MPEVKRSSLSPARRRLVALLQSVAFGRIEGLVVRDREPMLEPPPRIFRSVKLGGDVRPRPAAKSDDFVIKRPLLDLFDEFDRLGDGVVTRLDLKDGLPCSLVIEEPVLRMDAARPGREERETAQ